MKTKTNLKINLIVITLLLMLCAFTFTACGGDPVDTRPELTLTTNIEGAGTVSGGGHFDYNEDLFINAEVNSGYHFLGWYYDNDLLSTSAEYNCKMWDKDVTLEAKFIALPDDYDEEFGDMSPDEVINRNFKLSVVAGMPNYGKISVNDGNNEVQYSSSEKSGTNIKARALTTSSQRFLGWFDEADNLVMTNAVFNFSTPSFDYTLTAKWECDCEYTYNKENKTYACDACGASNSIYEIADKNGFVILNNELVAYIGDSTEITIPKNITTISSGVFSGNEEITSVNIPSNIKIIAANAFANCTSIRTITFADGATITEIGSSAFKNCSALSSIIIPNSVNIIGGAILSGCSSLQSVEIPFRGSSIYSSKIKLGDLFGTESYSGSKRIEQRFTAYYIPTTLKSVTVNGGVIEEYAFENCDMLTQIIINAPITTIPKFLFNTCSSLEEFTIPEGVTHIESYAFYKCTSLKTIFIPSTIQNISNCAFGKCTALETINYSGSELQWVLLEKEKDWAYSSGNFTLIYGQQSEDVKYSEGLNFSLSDDSKFYIVEGIGDCTDENIVVPVSYNGLIVREIGYKAFYGCHSMKSITLHDGIKSIGYSSFESCDNLINVTLGNRVTSIGEYAFRGCTGLTCVTIGNSVTTIGDSAFHGCTGLTSITIPNSVTSIGYAMFRDCASLTSVTIPDSVTSIGYEAFMNCPIEKATIPTIAIRSIRNSNLKTVIITSGESIDSYAFNCCTSLTSVIIGNSVTSIGEQAFNECTSLITVTIGNGVTSIGKTAFCHTGITNITIPNSVTSIGDWAFGGCASLTSVTIGNGVTSIGMGAFSGCTSLTSVVIPDSVTSIGSYAFEGCYQITHIKYRGTSSQWRAISKGSDWITDVDGHPYTITYNYKGE